MAADDNIAIFDEAAALVESTPLQSKALLGGGTVSYREYGKGRPHVLVMLPGYLGDDAGFSIIAVLPEFRDLHIIAVNPPGWNGSTMSSSVASHEASADAVMELLQMMKIERAMCCGYSTGGCIAFYMAQKYPKIISAAFLMHSIPLNGYHPFDESGNPIDAEIMAKNVASLWPDAVEEETYTKQMLPYMSNPDGFPPTNHPIFSHMLEAVKMPGKADAIVANITFNVTPIKTPYAEPSEALSGLKSKVIVIHSKKDTLIPGEQVECVTKLAISDNWAPPGTLSFYDSGEGHLLLFDNPRAFASVYRKVLEEQVLSAEESTAKEEAKVEKKNDIQITSQ